MIDLKQMSECVVETALTYTNTYSKSALRLVVGTGLVESNYEYLKQKNGPALGFWQMEPVTHDDIWLNYLSSKQQLRGNITRILSAYHSKEDQLIWNLPYAAIMCRVKYMTIPKPLPHYDDLEGLADYWKDYYNTHLGSGTPQRFMELANKFGIMDL